MKNRYPVTEEDIESAFEDVKTWLKLRLKQKGDLSYASPHEMWGIIDEELDEFKEQVRANSPKEQFKEMTDIAVGAVFSLATMHRWGKEYQKKTVPCPCHDDKTCSLHNYHHADESCNCNCKTQEVKL